MIDPFQRRDEVVGMRCQNVTDQRKENRQRLVERGFLARRPL
jgi:hypothetical protein